ncbi:MAG: endolytic transglycosylase MltG [Bacteroidales bacterium]|nr:endolytic transglycosylase MltG [Bacteroidales bacterium]MBO7378515.1 endolytic transglycosylase MltG [Bacteroidales bacterium]MBP5213764.1 endolytic transglycosylase MltG [Bacteroidales bacterium]MBP5764223.1 endolytic transglycosylase MltG [Bacteroidales bacterium]
MNRKRTLFVFIAVIAVLIIVAGGIAAYGYIQLKRKPWVERDCWVYVRQGDDAHRVLDQLAQDGGADTRGFWADAAFRLYHLDESLQRGIDGAYRMKAGASMADVLRKITHHQQDAVRLTFIGTRTVEDLAGRMARCVEADSAALMQAIFDPEFLALCECDSANVASFLLPDTYEVYWNIPPRKLMQRMLSEYHRFWNGDRLQKAAGLGLTPQEVSIVCSIAEEETANRQERGTVARLYWNRLQRGMPLQADPTVKFAVGDPTLRRILTRHLQTPSPYNTYLHPGLPPGPIRVVEKASIDAFLNSQPHTYLYMCAKEDFSGLHNFANTLTEHNRNAQRYHQALRRNGIR